MEDLISKERVVVEGHMTDVPLKITYARLVSHDTVKIF